MRSQRIALLALIVSFAGTDLEAQPTISEKMFYDIWRSQSPDMSGAELVARWYEDTTYIDTQAPVGANYYQVRAITATQLDSGGFLDHFDVHNIFRRCEAKVTMWCPVKSKRGVQETPIGVTASLRAVDLPITVDAKIGLQELDWGPDPLVGSTKEKKALPQNEWGVDAFSPSRLPSSG